MTEQKSDSIKTAYERAMERVANLETPSPEKRLEWKGLPEGKAHAVKCLKGEGDLAAALKRYDKGLQPYVLRGMVDVLAANLMLPKTPILETGVTRSLAGLRTLFVGKRKVEELLGRVQYVNDQYKNFGTQQRQQVFEDLKRQFAAQVQNSLRQQGLPAQPNVNAETLPEFQQEWQRIRVQMDQQYEEHLEAYRRELRSMAAEG